MYGIFGRDITKYTVIYGVYIRFWPTLDIGGRKCDRRKEHNSRVSHWLCFSVVIRGRNV